MLYYDRKHDRHTEYCEAFDRLIPTMGEATTVNGEALRCISRLAHEYYNNGNCNWDGDFLDEDQTEYEVNPSGYYPMMVDYLERWCAAENAAHRLDDARLSSLEEDLRKIYELGADPDLTFPRGEDAYDRVIDAVLDAIRNYGAGDPWTANS